MTDTTSFTIERRFDATPEELWDARTDPDEAAHWWHPGGVHTPRETVTIDAQVNGRYSYTMIHDETGETFPAALHHDPPRSPARRRPHRMALSPRPSRRTPRLRTSPASPRKEIES